HGKVAVASAGTERASQSLDGKFASLERRFNQTLKAQQDYEKIQRQINAAVAQNPALQDRANAVLQAAATHYQQGTLAQRAFAQATSGVNSELVAMASGAGPVGIFLAGLGPWGIAAGAGLTLARAGFSLLNDEAAKVGARSVSVRNFADSTGFAID